MGLWLRIRKSQKLSETKTGMLKVALTFISFHYAKACISGP